MLKKKTMILFTLLLSLQQALAQTLVLQCDYHSIPPSQESSGSYTVVIEPWHSTVDLGDEQFVDGKADPETSNHIEHVIINEAVIVFESLKANPDSPDEGSEYFIDRLTAEFWKSWNTRMVEAGSCHRLTKPPIF